LRERDFDAAVLWHVGGEASGRGGEGKGGRGESQSTRGFKSRARGFFRAAMRLD
jgi:hypothetical protein